MTKTQTSPITVRIGPALADELRDRLISSAPFDRIREPGSYDLTLDEAQEMLDDADFYADGEGEGPGASISFGLRQSYGSVARQIRAAGLRPTPTVDPDRNRDHRPTLGPPKPKPVAALRDVEPGRWVRHPVLGSCVVGSEDRVPARRRTPELVPLRKNGPGGGLVWRDADDEVELG